MLKNGVFTDARVKGRWNVKISYDPRNMDYIYVYDDNTKKYEKCFLTNAGSRYKEKTIEEIEYLLAVEKMQREKNKDNVAQAKAQLISEIEDIVKQAEEDYKKETSTVDGDKQRIKNIHGNRKAEKVARRMEEAFDLGNSNGNNQTNLDEEVETGETDTLQLLLRKQKEVMLNEGSDDT
jgi:hypothetical protein